MKKIKRLRYPNNVVILHRLRKGYNTPQMNPSLGELETWLKMAHIPYTVGLFSLKNQNFMQIVSQL